MSKSQKKISAVYWGVQGCALLGLNLMLLGFLGWGVYAAYTAYRLETRGAATEGIVVAMDESNSDGTTTYSPIVEYQVNGQTYRFDSNNSTYPPQYAVGDRVAVRYAQDDPSTAQIDAWSERWLMPVILVPAMCLTLLVINVLAFLSFRKGRDII